MLSILAESALRSLLLGAAVWVGLNLLRIRHPQVQMTAWVLVLVASLVMPLVMHWTTVTITVAPTSVPVIAQLPAPEQLWPSEMPVMEPLPAAPAGETAMPAAAPNVPGVPSQPRTTINWLAIATFVYAGVAAVLLLRLAIGLGLTWRLARAARPIDDPLVGAVSTAHARVRVSEMIGGPVTFGTTILLPPHHTDWDGTTRQAVLAHEGAHVANRDFYVLLLASLNRAVFWFSPFAWWQLTRLAELAEIISDDQALETFEDKLSYAEILLDMVQTARRAPAALQMARASTIRLRVERILAAPPAPEPAGWRKRIWTAAIVLPVAIASAGTIAFRSESVFVPAIEGAGEATSAQTPQQAAFYALGRSTFAVFRDGDDVFGQLSGQRKLRLAADGDGTYAYPAAAGRITFANPFISGEEQPSELMLRQNAVETHAKRIAGFAAIGLVDSQPRDATHLDAYAGWYEVAPGRVLTVTREGERLMLQETGRPKVVVSARGGDAFSARRDDLVIFLRNPEKTVTRVLLQEPVSDVRIAQRIPAARAKAIEEEFTRRIADVSDRFRDQSPQAGSKEAVLRGIEDFQHGTPNYARMSTQLAAKVRNQLPEVLPMFQAFGALESIFFRGVGPGGYDIYGVKFANGSAEFRLLLTPDGKADDVLFRPDGDEELGRFAACADEATLRAGGGGAPISLLIYNSSGRELQLSTLDAQGKRLPHGTLGDTMTSMQWTTVGTPWVVTDTSGRCVEIVLPGQRTRYHTVEPHTGNPPERQVARRTAPLAGSETTLRHYIEALSRGAPDYDRMTSEVATQTRQQLPFNQAILTRLGTLRAMSFRGVTGLGSDIYMAHFANGTAEWRISVARDGTVERIALGPQ